jgi:hypothetical protein
MAFKILVLFPLTIRNGSSCSRFLANLANFNVNPASRANFLPAVSVNANSSFSGYNLVYSGESLRMMFLLRLVCFKI